MHGAGVLLHAEVHAGWPYVNVLVNVGPQNWHIYVPFKMIGMLAGILLRTPEFIILNVLENDA